VGWILIQEGKNDQQNIKNSKMVEISSAVFSFMKNKDLSCSFDVHYGGL
jgi:hypothetical protein